jgi:hypothetical protein
MKTNCNQCGSTTGTCNHLIDLPSFLFPKDLDLFKKQIIHLGVFPKDNQCSIQVLSDECKKLYAETRGAYFTLTPKNDASGWILNISQVGEKFEGSLVFVLFKYVCYIKDNRELYPGKKNTTKPFRL